MPGPDARESRQLEWRALEQWAESGVERPRSDPTSVLPSLVNALSQDAKLIFGRVVDSIPYVGLYKVLPERGRPVMLCT
mgnify:FL=1